MNTDFVIYNIPQLAGVALSIHSLQRNAQNPRVIGVKNSLHASAGYQMFKDIKEMTALCSTSFGRAVHFRTYDRRRRRNRRNLCGNAGAFPGSGRSVQGRKLCAGKRSSIRLTGSSTRCAPAMAISMRS